MSDDTVRIVNACNEFVKIVDRVRLGWTSNQRSVMDTLSANPASRDWRRERVRSDRISPSAQCESEQIPLFLTGTESHSVRQTSNRDPSRPPFIAICSRGSVASQRLRENRCSVCRHIAFGSNAPYYPAKMSGESVGRRRSADRSNHEARIHRDF